MDEHGRHLADQVFDYIGAHPGLTFLVSLTGLVVFIAPFVA